MKIAFENILKAIKVLPENNQEFVIKQLKVINNNIAALIGKNDSFKMQLTGIDSKQFNDSLIKSIELLKLFGFNENTFAGISPSFLDWFITNTTTNVKFNPKLMNFFMLESMQQAYFICVAENEGIEPTYNQCKKTMLTFDETIKQYESDFKLSLPELIKRIDGQN